VNKLHTTHWRMKATLGLDSGIKNWSRSLSHVFLTFLRTAWITIALSKFSGTTDSAPALTYGPESSATLL